MRKSWSGQVAIVGIGESEIGTVPHKNPMQLHADATKAALEDCGLDKGDIDGVLTAGITNPMEIMHSVLLSEYLGVQPRFTTSMHIGGATQIQLVISAANAIHCGMADVVLIAGADSIRSFVGYEKLMGMSVEGVTDLLSRIGHDQFEVPYGPTLISAYALAAARHMHEYGTTREQLAQVAVSIRKHAAMHPTAQKTKTPDHRRGPRLEDDLLAPHQGHVLDHLRRGRCVHRDESGKGKGSEEETGTPVGSGCPDLAGARVPCGRLDSHRRCRCRPPGLRDVRPRAEGHRLR